MKTKAINGISIAWLYICERVERLLPPETRPMRKSYLAGYADGARDAADKILQRFSGLACAAQEREREAAKDKAHKIEFNTSAKILH